jgi:hypothetical protein
MHVTNRLYLYKIKDDRWATVRGIVNGSQL